MENHKDKEQEAYILYNVPNILIIDGKSCILKHHL